MWREEEKEKGMTIVINDFIKPYLGKLKLKSKTKVSYEQFSKGVNNLVF